MVKLHSFSSYTFIAGIFLLVLIQIDRQSYKSHFQYLGNDTIEIIKSEVPSKIFTIICHGYAGSKEMMRQLAFDIANAGSNAVIFDFIGHGSNSQKLINNPTELSGTTQQLVDQVITVIDLLKSKYGSDIKLNLIGHSMASDIVIRASEKQNISSIAAISPYSTKVTENFPQDLLLTSGQFEKHLRNHSLKFTKLIVKDADENIEYSNGLVRRKASYIKNTGHVSVIYSPQTSATITEWFYLNNIPRTLWSTHIIWTLLGLTMITYGLSRSKLSSMNYNENKRVSSVKSIVVGISSPTIALFSSLIEYEPFSIFGFGSVTAYFGLVGAATLLLCREIWENSERFNFYPFIKMLFAFSILVILINHFIGSFFIDNHRIFAFVSMIIPLTIFCVAIEKLISMSATVIAVFIRLAPLMGFSILLAIFPEKYGVMFTTVPIYICYFLVFGYIGKFQRKDMGSYTIGTLHGIFLAFSLAATNPIFSI